MSATPPSDPALAKLVAEVNALRALHHPDLAGDDVLDAVVDDEGTTEKVSIVDPWRRMVLREMIILRRTVEVQDNLIRRLIGEVKALREK